MFRFRMAHKPIPVIPIRIRDRYAGSGTEDVVVPIEPETLRTSRTFPAATSAASQELSAPQKNWTISSGDIFGIVAEKPPDQSVGPPTPSVAKPNKSMERTVDVPTFVRTTGLGLPATKIEQD